MCSGRASRFLVDTKNDSQHALGGLASVGRCVLEFVIWFCIDIHYDTTLSASACCTDFHINKSTDTDHTYTRIDARVHPKTHRRAYIQTQKYKRKLHNSIHYLRYCTGMRFVGEVVIKTFGLDQPEYQWMLDQVKPTKHNIHLNTPQISSSLLLSL